MVSRFDQFHATADFGQSTATVEPSPRGRSGVHVRFPNGWVVSVQWGPGTYSSNHDRWDLSCDAPGLRASTAEIAAWKGEGDMIEWSEGDTVQGYQSWDDVQQVLALAERDELMERREREA